MAKRAKISDIQRALMSQTDATPAPVATPEEVSLPEGPVVSLPEGMYEQLRALALYQKTSVEALVELAVADLLDLRKRQLDAALAALEAGEIRIT